MKRTLSFLAVIATLTACQKPAEPPRPLPFTEVLKRSAQASQAIKAVNFHLQAEGAITGSSTFDGQANLDVKGSIHNHGQQVAFEANVAIPQTEGEAAQASLSLVSLPQNELYIRLNSYQNLAGWLPLSEVVLSKFAEQWWHLPPSATAPKATAVTPSPQLLQAQAEVVRVTEDHGLVDLAGRPVYYYDVVVDGAKLQTYLKTAQLSQSGSQTDANLAAIQATGSIWIDASTFVPRRVQWQLTDLALPGSSLLNTTFSIDFANENNVAPVNPPKNAIDFLADSWFAVTDQSPANSALPPPATENLLESLLGPAPGTN